MVLRLLDGYSVCVCVHVCVHACVLTAYAYVMCVHV